jgi:hypothetical protein
METLPLFNNAFWSGFFDALLIGTSLIALFLLIVFWVPSWRKKLMTSIRKQRAKW